MVNEEGKQDRKLTAFARQQEALRLRGQGKSYDVIALTLGYANRAGAYKSVKSAMTKAKREGVAELRILEDRRLDDLQDAVWPLAMKGKPGSVRAALAILERRARLWGLDAPGRLEVGRLLQSEDWARVREAITGALEPWPEATAAVIEALRGVGE